MKTQFSTTKVRLLQVNLLGVLTGTILCTLSIIYQDIAKHGILTTVWLIIPLTITSFLLIIAIIGLSIVTRNNKLLTELESLAFALCLDAILDSLILGEHSANIAQWQHLLSQSETMLGLTVDQSRKKKLNEWREFYLFSQDNSRQGMTLAELTAASQKFKSLWVISPANKLS